MATTQDTVDFLLDHLAAAGEVTVKKMFGEYCLYYAGKPIGLVCDDQLYLKPTAVGRGMIANAVEGNPYPGAKPHLLVTPDQWEDAEWLRGLVQTSAQELPLPKPKMRKAKP